MSDYCPEVVARSLCEAGLDMLAVMPSSVLPDSILEEARIEVAHTSLLLVGNQGPVMWRALTAHADRVGHQTPDPVDDYVYSTVTQQLKNLLPDYESTVLYPRQHLNETFPHVPLQQLGSIAGWHHASPMGIGIHPDYGLWFAYRAVVCIDAVLKPGRWLGDRWAPLDRAQTDSTGESRARSVCEDCESQACQTACPANAITFGEMPDMQRCSSFRLREHSPCATLCLARNACPVGDHSRYDASQTAHHYSLSLASLQERIRKASRSV